MKLIMNCEESETVLLKERHVKFYKRCLDVLPQSYVSLDTSRLTVAFFAFSGLDVLGRLEVLQDKREEIIDWIYSLQVLPDEKNSEESLANCGFRGSPYVGLQYNPSTHLSKYYHVYDRGHVAMTYTGLSSLLIMGDDLSKVNKPAIAAGLRALQLPNGCFQASTEGTESDMRFLYCACCISHIIQDWSGVDRDKANDFIHQSLTPGFGIGQGPGEEGHSGITFCAIAALYLMGTLETTFTCKERDGIIRWCLNRQQTGFNGRPNKPVDTCYSFWVGATLKILGVFDLIDFEYNRNYILSTQDPGMGGFSKWPDYHPDALHAYLGLCGLSLMGEEGVKPINAALNISQTAANHLKSLHEKWKKSTT